MNNRGDIGAMMFLIFGALVATVFILLMLNKISQLTNFEELSANYHADEIKNTIEAVETQDGYFQTGYYIGKLHGVSVGFEEGKDSATGLLLKSIYIDLPKSKGDTGSNGQMISRPLLISSSDVLKPSKSTDGKSNNGDSGVSSQNIIINYSGQGPDREINILPDNVCSPPGENTNTKITVGQIKSMADVYVRGDLNKQAVSDSSTTLILIANDKAQYCSLYWKMKDSFKAMVELTQLPKSILEQYTGKKVMLVVS